MKDLKERLSPYAEYKAETGIAVTLFSTRAKIWQYVKWLESKLQQPQPEVSAKGDFLQCLKCLNMVHVNKLEQGHLHLNCGGKCV